MTAFITILWIIIGFIGAGFIGTELGPLFGYRHMEGMSAYFGLLVASPIGAIAGGFFGYAMSQKFADKRNRDRFMLGSVAIVVGVPFVAFIVESIRTSDRFENGMSLTCTIRLAPGVAAPDKSQKVTLELRSDKETRKSSPYSTPDWAMKDGRALTQESVEVYRATTDRNVAINIGGGPVYLFRPNTPARPKVYTYESEWLKPVSADGVAGAGQSEMEAKCQM